VGNAIATAYRVAKDGSLFGPESAKQWFGEPLQHSLAEPYDCVINFSVEIRRTMRHITILNCIDYLYGHCLLKLLNAEVHLEDETRGLVVIVPRFLLWLVPDGVAEIWQVDLPLSRARNYFPSLHQRICRELERFDSVLLSEAYPHPHSFTIHRYTRVAAHNYESREFRITFIWRSDRWWIGPHWVSRMLRRAGFSKILCEWQKRRVCNLFSRLRRKLPETTFTLGGLGTECSFPSWIDDRRVTAFTDETERALCKVYAESRVVVGVHGSNMLLPSAEAGMCVDLVPKDRWENIAQDVLYDQTKFDGDQRMAAFTVRYLPSSTSPAVTSVIIHSMLMHFPEAVRAFCRFPHQYPTAWPR
jgi:hypothetical protein